MGAEGGMSKRFVTMRKGKGGDWQAVSAHATQEAAQGATGNGGMVDTEAPWYRAWRPVGTKQWGYMPDDVRLAFEAREF
jgi:hypothetical protein